MADSRMIQYGLATMNTVAGTITGYASVTLQTVKGNHEWKDEVITDFNDFDTAWLARNENITVTINFKITGNSKALAIANGVFLAPLTPVTLSGFDAPWLNAAGIGGQYTGNWQYYKGGTIDLAMDKVGGLEINLRKYANPTQNTLAGTVAS